MRINGTKYRPKVFEKGKYTIKIGEPGTDKFRTISNINSVDFESTEVIKIDF